MNENNADGIDANGYNSVGYDDEGLNAEGYDADGYDLFDEDKNGYAVNGYCDGLDRYGYNKFGYDMVGLNKDGFIKWDVARMLLSNADRVTFDALRADGWSAELGDLLITVAALSAA
jgi:hypothetical protein